MKIIKDIIIYGNESLSIKIGELFQEGDVNLKIIYDGNMPKIIKADCIIETLPEDIEIKKKFFAECKISNKSPIFATTSMWGITEIAAVTAKPENFIGLNFNKNETTGEWLVQIVKGLNSSSDTVKLCKELLKKPKVTTVEIEDSPGLILYRPIVALINEATLMYMTGISSVIEIDETVKIRRRWPKGPFEIADEMGLDRVLKLLEILAAQMGDQYLPCLLLKKMVDAGRLGKMTGQGFYSYDQ